MIRLSNRAKKFLELIAAADCLSFNKVIERLIEQEAAKRAFEVEQEVEQGYRIGHRFDMSNGADRIELQVTRLIRHNGVTYHLLDNEGVAMRHYKSWCNKSYYIVAYRFEPGTEGLPEEQDVKLNVARQQAFMRFVTRKAQEAQETLGHLPAVLESMTPGTIRNLVTEWCSGAKWDSMLCSIAEVSKGAIKAPVAAYGHREFTDAQIDAIFNC